MIECVLCARARANLCLVVLYHIFIMGKSIYITIWRLTRFYRTPSNRHALMGFFILLHRARQMAYRNIRLTEILCLPQFLLFLFQFCSWSCTHRWRMDGCRHREQATKNFYYVLYVYTVSACHDFPLFPKSFSFPTTTTTTHRSCDTQQTVNNLFIFNSIQLLIVGSTWNIQRGSVRFDGNDFRNMTHVPFILVHRKPSIMMRSEMQHKWDRKWFWRIMFLVDENIQFSIDINIFLWRIRFRATHTHTHKHTKDQPRSIRIAPLYSRLPANAKWQIVNKQFEFRK